MIRLQNVEKHYQLKAGPYYVLRQIDLEMPLSYRDSKKSERQALVADILDRFGIVAKKDLFPRQM